MARQKGKPWILFDKYAKSRLQNLKTAQNPALTDFIRN